MLGSKDMYRTRRATPHQQVQLTYPSWKFMKCELKSITDLSDCWNRDVEPSSLLLTPHQDQSSFQDFTKLFGPTESKILRSGKKTPTNWNFFLRNKTLMFAIMLIEKSGLNWYSELLRLSMTESRDLQINPRNCIGTVLALNGHRKYFCMYHAKHPETSRGTKVSAFTFFWFWK